MLCRMSDDGRFFVTSPRGLGVRSRLATDRSTRRFSLQPAGFDPPRMRVLRFFRVLSPCLLGPIFYRRRHGPHLRGCLCRTFRDSLRLAALASCSARWLPFVEVARWRSEGMRAWSRVPGTNQSSERRSLLLHTRTSGCWHCTCRQRSVEPPRACTS